MGTLKQDLKRDFYEHIILILAFINNNNLLVNDTLNITKKNKLYWKWYTSFWNQELPKIYQILTPKHSISSHLSKTISSPHMKNESKQVVNIYSSTLPITPNPTVVSICKSKSCSRSIHSLQCKIMITCHFNSLFSASHIFELPNHL